MLWRARFLAPGAPCVEGMEFAGGEEVLPFSRETVRFAEVTVPAAVQTSTDLTPVSVSMGMASLRTNPKS